MPLPSFELLDAAGLSSAFQSEPIGGDCHAYNRELRTRFSELRNPAVSSNPGDPDAGLADPTPDWKAIIELAVDSLNETTKDLRIACHLTEAWMHTDRLAGLAKGLELIAEMLETGWDWINPPLDPEDAEVRTAPLENLLDDPNRGPCLPMMLRALPIVGNGSTLACLQDATRRGTNDDDRRQVNLAIASCGAEQRALLMEQHRSATKQLDRIQTVLTEKLESNAPGFTNLRESLALIGRWFINCFGDLQTESNTDVEDSIDDIENNLAELDATPRANGNRDSVQDNASIVRLSVQMRSDAYEQLTKAADLLQQIEPHSPIPYLIHRAVRLGQLPFPDLVGKLVHESATLDSLRDEFGLRVPTD